MPGATALLWFIEGMAEYLSLGSSAPLTAMWMRGAMEDTLPSYRDLLDPRFFPYRYGQALLAYVAGRVGRPDRATCFAPRDAAGTSTSGSRRCWR